MTVQIIITGEDGAAVLSQLRQFLIQPGVISKTEVVQDGTEEKNVEETKEAAKTRKPRTPKVIETAPIEEESQFTLQDAIDRAKEIAGDGKDENVMKKLQSINTKLGIGKVRELPPEKIAGYIEELEKAFPKEEQESVDASGMFDS